MIRYTGQGPHDVAIMALGDSITRGPGDSGSYRVEIGDLLAADGIAVRFAGTAATGAGVPIVGGQQHEGHDGYRTDMLADEVDGWIRAVWPDIVVLHIGTNDCVSAFDIPGLAARYEALVRQILARRPSLAIVLCTVGPIGPNIYPDADGYCQDLNATMPSLAATLQAEGYDVRVAYTRETMSVETHLQADEVHPTHPVADALIAGAVHTALLGVLGRAP